eukprot:TRINITY_DN3332_c0_g3_i1.p1 TRINITY_DN3332_c0_g3~~TRINITY_DN3332_c0_g3_i1.p1  ORF type:complete len:227 (+),score=53.65 TRINITY_DN3332_c0_g3_i1:83-763(+)
MIMATSFAAASSETNPTEAEDDDEHEDLGGDDEEWSGSCCSSVAGSDVSIAVSAGGLSAPSFGAAGAAAASALLPTLLRQPIAQDGQDAGGSSCNQAAGSFCGSSSATANRNGLADRRNARSSGTERSRCALMARAIRSCCEALRTSPKRYFRSKPDAAVAAQPGSEAEEGGSTCLLCLERFAVVAFIPCGHRCVCVPCAKRLPEDVRRRCCACRRPAAHLVRIFG